MLPADVVNLVESERTRQRTLWDRDHEHGRGDCSSPYVSEWVKFAVLSEEMGEVARALLEHDPDAVRRELVEVAAVAHAWLEGMS